MLITAHVKTGDKLREPCVTFQPIRLQSERFAIAKI
jgi:hypothetical protein